MPGPSSQPYGLWPSPITPASLAMGARLRDVAWDTDGETLVWLEGRSDRGVLVCAGPGGDAPRDLTTEYSVRARVGYGGGDLALGQGAACFVAEGRLFRQPLAGGAARAITPAYGEPASPVLSPDGRWLLYVHSYEGVDGLALVDSLGDSWPRKLICGDDFYMQPVWHPDGSRIAWVSWNHPLMPWDGSKLGLARLVFDGDGFPRVAERQVLAGGDETSIFQPTFSPDGRYLAHVSDETGWYGLYLHDLDTGERRALVCEEAELGVPAWAQGLRTYAWSPDGAAIYYCRDEAASSTLWAYDLAAHRAEPVAALQAYTDCSQVTVSSQGKLALIASSPAVPSRVLAYDPGAGAVRVVARSESESYPAEICTWPEALSWRSANGDTVHGLFYPPRCAAEQAAGVPPLLVSVHGGPTGHASGGYSAATQFWTTRGYAVLALNHRGSSGYGRAYRNKLRGQWGIYDVEDAVSGARHLAQSGRVDPERMVIMGGSAGGYTVLQTLCTHPGVFKAGLCFYGISNLFTLAMDTHKFEQHYLDSLIGPLPEAARLYRERSPIFLAERIVDPLAVFQGEDDRVVPLEQAEEIVAALARRGVPHEYHRYPGEGHGWRKAETIRNFYEALLAFLRKHVLFA